ncbi:GNAT family N-acetyltransferase [Ascidiaceihabitans sp.]|uniref:GNAT family N-acetyltransferase n=1 Tax=Ascidiaceihabitans sp. TaxID=1872644 RepID=UPI003298CFE3
MTLPPPETLYDVLESTWPAAAVRQVGPWMIRDGQGGGKRTSAATLQGVFASADIAVAEAEMQALGQDPLFMLRPEDTALDQALEARGYRVIDPVHLYAVPLTDLPQEPLPLVTAFPVWPPLAIARDIWAQGGISAARVAVMQRVTGAKTAILLRQNDHPAGVGFVAIHEKIAMIHAIEVTPKLRRQGVGAKILRAAGEWAQNNGATHLSLAVTRANTGGNALYTSLGMTVVGHYHYRIK